MRSGVSTLKDNFKPKIGNPVILSPSLITRAGISSSCEALPSPSIHDTLPVFKECFSKFGLPQVIRNDNGSPFASLGAPFGLTQLAVWFVKLGIILERIDPGHPEQNGRHERMHRTLKEEACQKPATNLLTQQDHFDTFKTIDNTVRPHEAIN